MDLTCPKCHAPMRSYERNGVNVDQCSECRGIFLDRGELERLVDAENSWHAASAAAPSSAPGPGGPGQQGGPGGHGGQGSGMPPIGAVLSDVLASRRQQQSGEYYGNQYGYPRKGKKSFLEQLFG